MEVTPDRSLLYLYRQSQIHKIMGDEFETMQSGIKLHNCNGIML